MMVDLYRVFLHWNITVETSTVNHYNAYSSYIWPRKLFNQDLVLTNRANWPRLLYLVKIFCTVDSFWLHIKVKHATGTIYIKQLIFRRIERLSSQIHELRLCFETVYWKMNRNDGQRFCLKFVKIQDHASNKWYVGQGWTQHFDYSNSDCYDFSQNLRLKYTYFQ